MGGSRAVGPANWPSHRVLLTISWGSLGNLAKLILALFVLAQGEAELVHAQITGSIIGTSLLGPGHAIAAGSPGTGEAPAGEKAWPL